MMGLRPTLRQRRRVPAVPGCSGDGPISPLVARRRLPAARRESRTGQRLHGVVEVGDDGDRTVVPVRQVDVDQGGG